MIAMTCTVTTRLCNHTPEIILYELDYGDRNGVE